MRGVASPITTGYGFEIFLETDGYRIGRPKFPRPSDKLLEKLTDKIIDCFDELRRAINQTESIKLDPEFCTHELVKLAEWGQTAYQEFFGDERCTAILSKRLRDNTAPTFVSNLTPFPWEVLFEGKKLDYKSGNPEMFWGFRYTPARILDPTKDITECVEEQALPSNMLFCLHHKLLYACQEKLEIEKLVKATGQDRFSVLGSSACSFSDIIPCGSDEILNYLDQAHHNMLHFACHCQEGDLGDRLIVSLIGDELEAPAQVIELETYMFSRMGSKFLCQPLVFLNACQSAGGSDDLRRTFNLPKVFHERGAAAVIATVCTVPDIFAAAFAKVFYKFFLQGIMVADEKTGEEIVKLATIGEALRATRWYFLKEYNNPLGLAYGLYSPAHYRLTHRDANSNKPYLQLTI